MHIELPTTTSTTVLLQDGPQRWEGTGDTLTVRRGGRVLPGGERAMIPKMTVRFQHRIDDYRQGECAYTASVSTAVPLQAP